MCHRVRSTTGRFKLASLNPSTSSPRRMLALRALLAHTHAHLLLHRFFHF